MRPRRGFTLVEVMIALVILGIVTGAIYRLLDANRRIAVAQAEQVMLQSNVRTGSLIGPNELRELNTVATAGAGAQTDIIISLMPMTIEPQRMLFAVADYDFGLHGRIG